jgi:hypothetical protein
VWSEIRRSGLTLQETAGAAADKLIVHTSNNDIVTLSNAKIGAEVERVTAAYMGDSREILPLPHDPFGSDEYRKVDGISARERLASVRGISSLYRDILDGNLAGCGHNYTDKFAWIEMVRWYALPGHNVTDMDDASGRYHFTDGTVSLLNALLAEGKPQLRLGTPVRRVIQEEDHITVITSSGEELRAKAVVSTVPLNVLGDIDWQPALAQSKLQASRERHAGSGTKVHAIIEGDYGNFGCVAPSQFALNAVLTEGIEDGHTHVIGFGPDAALLDVNDSQAVEKAMRLFIPDAKVIRTIGYQLTLDPYSKGTWCTLRPGMWWPVETSLEAVAFAEPCRRRHFRTGDLTEPAWPLVLVPPVRTRRADLLQRAPQSAFVLKVDMGVRPFGVPFWGTAVRTTNGSAGSSSTADAADSADAECESTVAEPASGPTPVSSGSGGVRSTDKSRSA